MRGEFSYHGGPTNKAPIPACASATLLYAYRIIKPGSQALSTIQKPPLIATINRDEVFWISQLCAGSSCRGRCVSRDTRSRI